MCVLVTFDINLAVMENIVHDHHESGVIKYVWTSTILGFTNTVPALQIRFDPGGYC